MDLRRLGDLGRYHGSGEGGEAFAVWSAKAGKNIPATTHARWGKVRDITAIADWIWDAGVSGAEIPAGVEVHRRSESPSTDPCHALRMERPSQHPAAGLALRMAPGPEVRHRDRGSWRDRQVLVDRRRGRRAGLRMDLLGIRPKEPLRVWLWNLEDPQEETQRKFRRPRCTTG